MSKIWGQCSQTANPMLLNTIYGDPPPNAGTYVVAFEESCFALSDQDMKVVATLSHGQEPFLEIFSVLYLIVLWSWPGRDFST